MRVKLLFPENTKYNFCHHFGVIQIYCMKFSMLLFMFLSGNVLQAQKEANIWYFGNLAGLDFNSGSPVALTNGQMSTLEGCATISTFAGRLLFYTDGIKVWDSTHTVMPNGTGLRGNSSSTQSAVVVPRPDSANRFYVFTVDATAGSYGARYSELNMRLNSNRGDIISSSKNTSLIFPSCEKITAVKHANGRDYWVLLHKYNSDTIYSYLISPAGVSTTPVKSKTGLHISTSVANTLGYMKISPDSKKIGYVNYTTDTSAIGDFNSSTGVVSNIWKFYNNDGYGLEFSGKSSLLYLTDFANSKLYQYNALATSRSAFLSSRVTIDSLSTGTYYGALQLGPDAKIYISVSNGTSLHVIHAPDSSGRNCRVQRNAVSLNGRQARFGLPTFIQSYFFKKTFSYFRNCVNDSTFFSISDTANLDSFKWIFGDPSSGVKNSVLNQSKAYHIYKKSGIYKVQLISYIKNIRDTGTQFVRIRDPKPRLGNDISICGTFKKTLSPLGNYLSYKWNIDSTKKLVTVNKKGTYILTVKDSALCFASDTIQIINPIVDGRIKISDTIQCFTNNAFTLKDSSIYNDDQQYEVNWFFGDGSSKTGNTVLKKYAKEGRYKVLQVIYSKENCLDSTFIDVNILPSAKPVVNINAIEQCFNNQYFSFLNSSTLSNGTMTYNWTLGDGTSSSDKDVIGKKYTKDSSYLVRLIVNTDKNCKDTSTNIVVLHASPKAKFTIQKDKQCFKGNVFQFSNSSSISKGNIQSNQWTMGDGQNRNTKDVFNYTYNQEDTFTIRLIAISNNLCRDTIHNNAITFPHPIINVEVPNDSQCWQKNDFSILNNTIISKGVLTHTWDFGDGSNSNLYQPINKSYSNTSAQYTIKYKVVSDIGCMDSFSKKISLLERPISAFIINDSVQCFNGNLFQFSNQTNFSAMNTLRYFWDYGNGITSVGYTAKDIVYAQVGYYPVQLVSYSTLNNCYDTIKEMILVAPHAVVDFKIDNDSQCRRNNLFSFQNSSSLSFGTMNYQWRFSEGQNINTKDAAKQFKKLTQFHIAKLFVTTNNGCLDSVSKTLTLIENPIATFDINDSAQCLNQHDFSTYNKSSDIYGDLNNKWIFDDASESQTENIISKKFIASGIHSIKLVVVSEYKCTDTITKKVYLERNKAISIQTNDDISQCLIGNSFTFNVRNAFSEILINAYNWDIGPGPHPNNSQLNYSFNSVGQHIAKVETISSNGCKDTTDIKITIHPHPISSFSANSVCFPEGIQFQNTSQILSGVIARNIWLFGDGLKSEELNPKHKYASAGKYKVTLITESNFGCMNTLEVTDAAIVMEKPDALFNYTKLPTVDYRIISLKMNNLSKDSIVEYNWDFDNGEYSKDKDPIIDYQDTSRKWISLVVFNSARCSDTFKINTGVLLPDFFLHLPNAFSPNENGTNDLFKPLATPYFKKYTMEIYNRWGEKLFVSNDYNLGWDGKYMGEDCAQGVYLCRIYVIPMNGKLQSFEVLLTLLR